MKRFVVLVLLAASTPLAFAALQSQARAQPQAQSQTQTQVQNRARIYGSQMMTPAERASYRQHMRQATTQAERDRIRAEHHNAMQERAKARGVMLPEMPAQPMHRGRMMPRNKAGQGGSQGGGGG